MLSSGIYCKCHTEKKEVVWNLTLLVHPIKDKMRNKLNLNVSVLWWTEKLARPTWSHKSEQKCLMRSKHFSKSGFNLLSFYKLIIFPVKFWFHQTSMWQIYWRTIQPLYDTRFVKRLSDEEQNPEIFFPTFENPSHIRDTTLKLCSIYLIQFWKIGQKSRTCTLWCDEYKRGCLKTRWRQTTEIFHKLKAGHLNRTC